MERKTAWIKIGDFFFKYRNIVFPIILVTLFFSFPPAHSYLGSHQLEIIKDWIAATITAFGLLFRASVIGFAYIKRGGLNKKVYAEDLVTEGFFGICRNPLYVGNMLIYIGVFLMHGNPTVFVIGTTSYYLLYSSIISAEEFFLRQKFGSGFENYCRDVPRWIPNFSQYSSATEGMRFNLRRVVLKDYPTVANAFIALMLLELLESYRFDMTNFKHVFPAYGVVLICVVAITAMISIAKKRKWLTLEPKRRSL